MQTAVDLIEALQYKLHMFGIPLDELTTILCDNEAVVQNSTAPELTLKKKHNAINYHCIREAQAASYVRIAKVAGAHSLADLFTKVMTAPRRKELVRGILW